MNLLPFIFLIVLAGFVNAKPEERWVVKNESLVTIRGTSNIGNYSCGLTKLPFTDTLKYTSNGRMLRFRHNRIELPVAEFNCNNSLMNRDFQELLKAKDNEFISVEFLELENQETIGGKRRGKIRITIIDKQKIYYVNFDHQQTDSRNFLLSGQAELKFSDFDLVAPRRFGGIIKIDEVITVNFRLNIQKS